MTAHGHQGVRRLEGRLRGASSRLRWRLNLHLPQVFPLFVVTGFPKSGTTWACALVSGLTGLPFHRKVIVPRPGRSVFHGHVLPDPRTASGLYVMRDGRDCMTSFYFHFLRFVPPGNQPAMPGWLDALFPGLVNRDDTARNFPRFIERQMTAPIGSPVNWGQHVTRYMETCRDRMPCWRYEDLTGNPKAELSALADHLGMEAVSEDALDRVVASRSFKTLSGRASGTERRGDALRKGTVGDWKNHFCAESREIFHHYCGEALMNAGYVSSDDWRFGATMDPSTPERVSGGGG